MSLLSGLSCRDLKFRWKIEPIRKEEQKLKVQIRSEESAIQRLVVQREALGEKSSSYHEGTTHPPGALNGTAKTDDNRQETVLRLRCERRRKKLACLHAKKLDIMWNFVKDWFQLELDRLSVETCLKNNRSVCRLADYYTRYPKDIADEEELWRRAEEVMSACGFTVDKDNSGRHDPAGCGESSLDEDSSSQTSSIDILDIELEESEEENHVDKEGSIPCDPSTSIQTGKQEDGGSPKKISDKRRTQDGIKMNINGQIPDEYGARDDKVLSQAPEDDEISPWPPDSKIRSYTVSNEVENGHDEAQGAEGSMMIYPVWMTKYMERVVGTSCQWEFNDDAKAEFARRLQLGYDTESLTREGSKAFIEESVNIGKRYKSEDSAVTSLYLRLVEEPQVPVCSDKVQYNVKTTSAPIAPLDRKSTTETRLPGCLINVAGSSLLPRRPTYAEKTRSRPTNTKDNQSLVCSDRVQQRTVASTSAPPTQIPNPVKYQPRPHKARGSKYPKSPRFPLNRAGKSRRREKPNQVRSNEISANNHDEVDTAGASEMPSGSGRPIAPRKDTKHSSIRASSNAVNPSPSEQISDVKVSPSDPKATQTEPRTYEAKAVSSSDPKTSQSKPNNDAETSVSTPSIDAKRHSSTQSIGTWMLGSDAEAPPHVPITDRHLRAPSDDARASNNGPKASTFNEAKECRRTPNIDEIHSKCASSNDRELCTEELEPPSGVSRSKVREETVSKSASVSNPDFTISFIGNSTGAVDFPRKTTESTRGGTTRIAKQQREHTISFVHNPLEAYSGDEATNSDVNSDERDSSGRQRPEIPLLDLSKLTNSSPEPIEPSKIRSITETYDGVNTLGKRLERYTVASPSVSQPRGYSPVGEVKENYRDPFVTQSYASETPFDFVFHGCVTTSSFPTTVMPSGKSPYSLSSLDRQPSPPLGIFPSNYDASRPIPYNCFRPFSNSWLGGFSPISDSRGGRNIPLIPPTPSPPQPRAPGQVLQRQWCPNEAAANHIKQMLRISNERCFGYQHRHPAFQQIRSGNPSLPAWTQDKGVQSSNQSSYNDLQRVCPAPLSSVQNARATGDAPCQIHSFPSQYSSDNQSAHHALNPQQFHEEQIPWLMDRKDGNGNNNTENSLFFPSSSVFENSLGI